MLQVSSPMRTPSRGFAMLFGVLAAAALVPAQAQTAAPTAASAPAAKPAVHAAKKTSSTARASMDLHAPPLSHIYPSAQLRYILAADESGDDTATEVNVRGSSVMRVPVAPGNQLQAIPWAILHPTQAWRIFTPLEEQ